ncbi:MAG TPA: FAD-dependent oxidoreductase [Rhizomicrobium sp.]|nr:FAD-dependent oxidoreductase [Rhizomicrobium sp.]
MSLSFLIRHHPRCVSSLYHGWERHLRSPGTSTCSDFAVVGSGIAGMAAAWLLSAKHRVTVYEREARVGGHSHTVDVETAHGTIPVDTGFIVYNEPNYPNLTALFHHLDVPTKPSNMGFAVSLDGGALEYAGSLAGLAAQPGLFLRRDYRTMLTDTLRFYRDAPKLLAAAKRMSLGEYLAANDYSDAFARLHLLPMGAAIWSSSVADMRAHPVAAFARFFVNHGLLKLSGRPRWRTVDGGSREYVKRLTARYATDIHVASGVATILRDGAGVTIVDARGNRRSHDGVIIAAPADQALGMLAEPTAEERALLGSFRYRPNQVVLHSDAALMPKRRRAWASWNYLGRSNASADADLCVTYWMNALQGIDRRAPLFVTLNPPKMPREDKIHRVLTCAHPVFDAAALDAQSRLWHLQGARRTSFCGSYFGSGFHEDALQAGLAAAEDAGGVRRPWRVANESGRIARIPQLAPAAA